MNRETALRIFETLSAGIHLDIFRLLVRMGPEGMVAGDIATQLDLPPSNLTFHLKAMSHHQLLGVTQEGRFQRYRANMEVIPELIAFLTDECCAGHPAQCVISDAKKRSA